MKAKTKNGFAPKVCQRCKLEFEWRKKWARDWEEVKYCSERCKSNKQERYTYFVTDPFIRFPVRKV
jgi:hypothetical protein